MKIVINGRYGGFGLSPSQVKLLELEKGNTYLDFYDSLRQDPRLVASVLAGDDGDSFAKLQVVEIPDGAHFQMYEHAGVETVFWSETPIYVAEETSNPSVVFPPKGFRDASNGE